MGFEIKQNNPKPEMKKIIVAVSCWGFWGWSEQFLNWGSRQWHFVIGVLSRDRQSLHQPRFTSYAENLALQGAVSIRK